MLKSPMARKLKNTSQNLFLQTMSSILLSILNFSTGAHVATLDFALVDFT